VASLVTVTQPDAANAVPAEKSPSAVTVAAAAASAYVRTRRGVDRMTAGIVGGPQAFFTTAGLIGTLHVDLERCNLDGASRHEIGTRSASWLRLNLRVSHALEGEAADLRVRPRLEGGDAAISK
jgi:hypothetical protein